MKLLMIPLSYTDEEVIRLYEVIRPTTVLAFEEDAHDIFCQLHDMKGRFLPPTITPSPFRCSQKISLCLYSGVFLNKDEFFGELFTFVYADQLRNLNVDSNPRHKAIKAYIDSLPDKTRIVLYWHR